MAKILFFTAAAVVTTAEQAAIAKLNAAAVAPYEVQVLNGGVSGLATGQVLPCDFVAGTVPTAYNAKTVIDPDAIPAALVEGSMVGLIDGGGTEAEATVDGDGLAALGGDFALVENAVSIPITGGAVALTVVAGEITGGTFTPA